MTLRTAVTSRALTSRQRSPLSRFALTLLPLSIIAGGVTKMADESSAQAADNVLRMLLLNLLPLALGVALLPLHPVPRNLAIALGQDRRQHMLLGWLRLAGATSLLTMATTAALLLTARTSQDPQLADDLRASLPIAFGATLATLSLLTAARLWTGQLGLSVTVVLCWTLGQSDLVLSGLFPGGHIRALLGLGTPLPLSPSLSAACLALATLAFGSLFLSRVPR